MKLVAAVLVGVFVTFTLTALAEMVVMSLRDRGERLPHFEAAVMFPLIALIVGCLVALIAKNKARLAAILGFAPWIAYLLLEAGRRHAALSWRGWVILITLTSIYCGLGVGAAVFVSARMNRSVVANS
jgi:hypothetical protein